MLRDEVPVSPSFTTQKLFGAPAPLRAASLSSRRASFHGRLSRGWHRKPAWDRLCAEAGPAAFRPRYRKTPQDAAQREVWVVRGPDHGTHNALWHGKRGGKRCEGGSGERGRREESGRIMHGQSKQQWLLSAGIIENHHSSS